METNTNKYAYATLIATENYVWGAICCAISAKIMEVKYPFYLLVNEEIYNKKFYDDLIETLKPLDVRIKLIENKKFNTNIEERYKCTLQKLEVLLFEEEKVFFLDADAIIYKNPDELFDLEAPYIFENRNKYDKNVVPYRFCGEAFIITTSKADYDYAMEALAKEQNIPDNLRKLRDDECIYEFLYGYKATLALDTPNGIFEYIAHYAPYPKYWLESHLNNIADAYETVIKFIMG